MSAGCCTVGLLAGCARDVGAATTTAGATSTITSSPTPSTPFLPAAGPGTSGSEARYLAAARRAYPERDDQALRAAGRDICARVAAHSAHDEVGRLAGELGNQAQANEVVDAATFAYCPASLSATTGSTPTS